jgi:hypothetical protein
MMNRSRVSWILLALALMFASAYSAMRWIGAVGAFSGWIGLPQYASQLPKLTVEADWWKWLGLILPFAAAFLLGLGRSRFPRSDGPSEPLSATEPQQWFSPLVRYLGRLAVSVAGTLAFFFCLLLIGFALAKLGVHSG